MTEGPGDLKNGGVTKVKSKFLKNFQIYFLDLFHDMNKNKVKLNILYYKLSLIYNFFFYNGIKVIV